MQGRVKSLSHLLSTLILVHDILMPRHQLYPKMQLKQTGERHGTTWPFSAYPRAVPCPAPKPGQISCHKAQFIIEMQEGDGKQSETLRGFLSSWDLAALLFSSSS